MKILVNSKDPNGISFLLYQQGLKNIPDINFNDFNNYKKYDIVLFFIYQLDHKDLIDARKKNNQIIIGIIDPRQNLSKKITQEIDFLVVDSIEMKDYYLKLNKPILFYYEFESTITKKAKKEDQITHIGYHGNKVHLLSMFPSITNALSKLSEKYNIKILLLYNHNRLGKLPKFMTKNINVEYLQWNQNNLDYFLSKVDIGIVPNFKPILFKRIFKFLSLPFTNLFITHTSDYLVSYKMTSGPNRILTFAANKIPVVSDMYPSACQVINHEKDGFLAYSESGWYNSIEKLIINPKLKDNISKKMHQKFKSCFDFEIQNERFLIELNKLNNSLKNRELNIQNHRSEYLSLRPFIYFLINELYLVLKKQLRRLLK
ncbi:hypothetical protein OAA74_02740 [Flavobacteriaceae bacterium]|nr:hypothetical protein [Flavobacteriaceae bacterium]